MTSIAELRRIIFKSRLNNCSFQTNALYLKTLIYYRASLKTHFD